LLKEALAGLSEVKETPLAFELPSNFSFEAAQKSADKHVSSLNENIKHSHGTTTMAFLYNDGVLVAVDSRASMGSYIGSGSVKKVIEISKYLLGTMAGGAADCSYWERNLAFQCRLYELREGKPISTAAASKLLGNTVYYYRNYGLSMGTMICGYDLKGPSIYYMDNDGTRMGGERFAVGSGATYAWGVLDQGWKRDMNREQAIELGKRAIYHATCRDAYSGGTINVYYIEKDGWTKAFSGDTNDLHWGVYAKGDGAAFQTRVTEDGKLVDDKKAAADKSLDDKKEDTAMKA